MNLNHISPKEFVIIAAFIAIQVAEDREHEEINLLGDFFNAIAHNLYILSDQRHHRDKYWDKHKKRSEDNIAKEKEK